MSLIAIATVVTSPGSGVPIREKRNANKTKKADFQQLWQVPHKKCTQIKHSDISFKGKIKAVLAADDKLVYLGVIV